MARVLPRQGITSIPAPPARRVRARDLWYKPLQTPKSEFETRSEYQARIRDKLATLNNGAGPVAMDCEVQPVSRLIYRPEERKFYGSIYGPMETKEAELGTFRGTNSYGASVIVRRVATTTWEINYGFIEFEASIDPTYARDSLPDLYLGVTAEPNGPFYKESEHQGQATLADPVERRTQTYTAYLRPTRAVIYNRRTQDVVWQAPIQPCRRYLSSSETELRVGPCPRGP